MSPVPSVLERAEKKVFVRALVRHQPKMATKEESGRPHFPFGWLHETLAAAAAAADSAGCVFCESTRMTGRSAKRACMIRFA